jgi:hypothetical protein
MGWYCLALCSASDRTERPAPEGISPDVFVRGEKTSVRDVILPELVQVVRVLPVQLPAVLPSLSSASYP